MCTLDARRPFGSKKTKYSLLPFQRHVKNGIPEKTHGTAADTLWRLKQGKLQATKGATAADTVRECLVEWRSSRQEGAARQCMPWHYCEAEAMRYSPQHFLNFLPDPHGHNSLRPVFTRIACGCARVCAGRNSVTLP